MSVVVYLFVLRLNLGSTETHPRRFDPPQCESESGPFKSSSSAVPRWLYIIPWSHQGIPFLQNIISLLICTHRPTDHSFIIQWQTKVTMSRSYQAGRPEPTVGPAQPPGSIAGRCWLATDNSRNRISEIPALWHISDILHFCKLTFCQHAVRQQPGSATIAMNLGTPPKL